MIEHLVANHLIWTTHNKVHLRKNVASPEIDWQSRDYVGPYMASIALFVSPGKESGALFGISGLSYALKVSEGDCGGPGGGPHVRGNNRGISPGVNKTLKGFTVKV